jgi:hypothetical protein
VADGNLIASTITALATVAAAGGAAFVGVWLGPRRYRSEHMWDEKFKTYTLIFDSMNHLLEEIDHLLDEEMHDNVGLTPGFRSELPTRPAKLAQNFADRRALGRSQYAKKPKSLLRSFYLLLIKPQKIKPILIMSTGTAPRSAQQQKS